jgi:type I restriction enzyme S subunit
LFYSFLSKPIQEQIKLISNGSAQENISNKTIENFYIPFPSADQQVAIANFLDKKCEQINQFIADKKLLINLLKEQRQSVIDEILIPNSDTWVFTRLKNIVEINKNVLPENTSKNYDLQYIDIGNVDSNGNIAQLQQLKFGNAPSRARRIVKYNDILISTVRTYLRAITINKKSDENIICSTGYAVLQTNELILPELLIEILRSERFISKVVSNSVGVSYPAITPTALGTLELAYPKDINVQNEIIAKIKSETKFIDETIFKTEEELRLVAEYKEALISNAVTGQLHIA